VPGLTANLSHIRSDIDRLESNSWQKQDAIMWKSKVKAPVLAKMHVACVHPSCLVHIDESDLLLNAAWLARLSSIASQQNTEALQSPLISIGRAHSGWLLPPFQSSNFLSDGLVERFTYTSASTSSGPSIFHIRKIKDDAVIFRSSSLAPLKEHPII
jgi:hypothetical protein